MSCAVTVRSLARRLGQMSEAELRKHHRVLHKRLQRRRPLDQSRRRAALVKETSDEADRRGWCTGAGTCAVSPVCGGPRAAVPASPGCGSGRSTEHGGGGLCYPLGQQAMRMRCSTEKCPFCAGDIPEGGGRVRALPASADGGDGGGCLKPLSSQCRHRTRRLTPRHGHVDWSESDSSWRGIVAGFLGSWVLTFLLGWIGFATMLNASLIVRIGIGLILGQFLMIPFLP